MELMIFLKSKSYDAVGIFNADTKETIVKKGSIVSPNISSAPKFRSANTIKKQREISVDDNRILKEDLLFKSPSSAANFVTGHSKNGYITWKNENGKILKDIVDRK